MPEFVVGENFEGINVQSFLRKHCSVSARLLSRCGKYFITEKAMATVGIEPT